MYVYFYLENISLSSKNEHIYRLINPTHTEFIYLIGKFLQNNSTV